MANIEKLRKQQEANEKKIKKANDKRWLKWFNSCLKLIKKRIKQAVKNGETNTRIESNDLFTVVSWKVSDGFNFTYLAKRLIEKLHEEGFYSFFYPGCGWVTSYITVGWKKIDNPIQKFKNECEYFISLNYTRSIGLKYYLSVLEIISFLKDKDIEEAITKNMDPETFVKTNFSYLFKEE